MCGCTSGYPTATASLSLSGNGTVVNPLSGLPLRPGQALVIGPDYTGPRKTVVNLMDPLSWPKWITSYNGEPRDDGSIAGGTWSGPQQLATVQVTARRGWLWLVVGILAVAFAVRATR